MNKIHDALREEWIGKQFVYESKYGSETIGEIEDVLIVNETRFDTNTENRIKEIVKEKSENKPNSSIMNKIFETRKVKESNEFEWIGFRPSVEILSTNNIIYKLDEIYILSSL